MELTEYRTDMEGGFGSGVTNPYEAGANLQKALEMGEGIAAAGSTGGTALRLQSLENTLKQTDIKEEHCIGWKLIHKVKAGSIAEEYTRDLSHGTMGDGFIPEIATPPVVDSSYERLVKNCRFMGITKELSLASLLNKVITPVEALEARKGVLAIKRQLEWNLFEGDHTTNPLSWDGIYKQVKDEITAYPQFTDKLVVDLRGKAMTPDALEGACATISQNLGDASDFISTVSVHSDLARQLYDSMRWQRGDKVDGDRYGLKVKNFVSQSSNELVALHTHKILGQKYGQLAPTAASGASSPSAPSVAKSAISDSDTQLDNDTYQYVAVAWGQGGYSAPSTSVEQATTGNQSVQLVLTNPAGVLYYDVYRAIDSTNYYFLERVAASSGATTTYVDDGSEVAGTSKAFLLAMDSDQVLAFHRLTDVMKMDLAQVGTAKRFMILLFGTPIVYNPRRIVVFKNVGNYTAP